MSLVCTGPGRWNHFWKVISAVRAEQMSSLSSRGFFFVGSSSSLFAPSDHTFSTKTLPRLHHWPFALLMFFVHWASCSHMKKKKKKRRRKKMKKKRCSHFRFIHTFPSNSRRSFIPSETLFPPDPADWSHLHSSPPRQYQSPPRFTQAALKKLPTDFLLNTNPPAPPAMPAGVLLHLNLNRSDLAFSPGCCVWNINCKLSDKWSAEPAFLPMASRRQLVPKRTLVFHKGTGK